MSSQKAWVIPIIGFCCFVLTMIVVAVFAYDPKLGIHTPNSSEQMSQHVTNIENLQNAINSSLR
ncbi:hypothetical protein [Helicobacter pametensis]|uniref:hypothetical protein n=1 Tax=Helicobacter pametensis TaxID=95149 RepID=UPI0004849285|nr:hypothetical protein [Helicobacter pametensis]